MESMNSMTLSEEANLLCNTFDNARVKLAKVLDTKEWCAVKIVKDTSSSFQLNSFMEEIRILSQCKNIQIVNLLSASTTGCLVTDNSKKPISYIVTSYAKFGELYKIIQETGPLSEPLARSYFVQLLKGIEYLHSINICHRDIKLENLLLDQDSRLIIADFGSASTIRIEAGKSLPFDSSLPVGSREYNSPEMNMEKNYYGEKADIFAAGICLFLMLLGHPPFREASLRDSHFKKLARTNKEDYWNIYKTANIPPQFKDLFEKMVETDSSKRIELRDIYAHPWMAGLIYTAEELKTAMRDRIQAYLKLRLRQTREMMKVKKGEQKKGEVEKEKLIGKEKGVKGFGSGCNEIRRRLDFESNQKDIADKVWKQSGSKLSSKTENEKQEKENNDKK